MAQAHTLGQLRQLYRIYKLVSDNAHGNITGFTGSLNVTSVFRVLNALNISGQGRRLFDCGAADGKVLAVALIMGSDGTHGFELPENSANWFIFQSVLNRITPLFGLNLQAIQHTRLEFSDIANVRTICLHSCIQGFIFIDCRSRCSLLDLRVSFPSGLEWSTISKLKFCDFVQLVPLLMESLFFATENGRARKKVRLQ
jgi:hypothetical protein